MRFVNYSAPSVGVRERASTAAVIAIATWLIFSFVMLGRSCVDQLVPFNGVVVAKGIDHSVVPVIGSPFYYLVLRDSTGTQHRRFVSSRGYLVHVGGFVVKSRGFGEEVHEPGKRSYEQLMNALHRPRRDSIR